MANNLPGLEAEVFFGDAETPLPDWRKVLPEENDDDDNDELTEEEKQSVIGMIGFDPGEPVGELPKPKVKPSPFLRQ